MNGMELLIEVAKQIPALVVLVWLVAKGAQLGRELLRQFHERDERFVEALREVGKDCHEHASQREERLIAALDKTGSVLEEATRMLGKN